MYWEILGDGEVELPSVIEAISSHSNRLDEFDKLHLTPMVCINIIIFILFSAHIYITMIVSHACNIIY